MIELLRNRRSIRKYTAQKVEIEKIEVLKEAVLRSPSSKNINPWEFVFVDDKTLIEKLKSCKPHGVAPLSTAPFAIVVCADETKNDVWVEDCSHRINFTAINRTITGFGKLLGSNQKTDAQ